LDQELAVVRPEVVVCLGATAAQTLLGPKFSVVRDRGKLVESNLPVKVLATVHPSSILRAPDSESRKAEMIKFAEDLKVVAGLLRTPAKAA
jgi:DNA polymerase